MIDTTGLECILTNERESRYVKNWNSRRNTPTSAADATCSLIFSTRPKFLLRSTLTYPVWSRYVSSDPKLHLELLLTLGRRECCERLQSLIRAFNLFSSSHWCTTSFPGFTTSEEGRFQIGLLLQELPLGLKRVKVMVTILIVFSHLIRVWFRNKMDDP